MSHRVTIQLSETTFKQLKRAAELAQKSLDVIVESSLAHVLAPLLEDIPAEYQADVYPLLEMNETELRREVFQRFPAKQWAEYENLLEAQCMRALTRSEETRFEQLKHQANLLSFRKSYAAVLLKQQGYPVPTLQEHAQRYDDFDEIVSTRRRASARTLWLLPATRNRQRYSPNPRTSNPLCARRSRHGRKSVALLPLVQRRQSGSLPRARLGNKHHRSPLQSRAQNWNEHFAWDETQTRIEGLTSIGRATINALDLNDELRVRARALWVKAGYHPPTN